MGGIYWNNIWVISIICFIANLSEVELAFDMLHSALERRL